MNSRTVARGIVLVLAVAVVALVGAGCRSVPTGTTRQLSMGASALQAVGAGIVKADAQKTTFRVKCGVCGYETEEMTLDTPSAGKPCTLKWVCPRCGHKQTVIIQVVGS